MINIRMQHNEVQKLSPKIIVVGVGGAGGNAVNNMISAGLEGVEFLVCNTDAQSLEGSLCENKLQLGASVTSGLGAGARPEIGRDAAEESLDEVLQYLEGANMAFVTAGMGGGTGTGAAPVIAKAARERGILTVGVVTKPFHFEGTYRMKMAEEGIQEMQDYVDTLIVIPNQNLFRIANEKTTFSEAFRMADGVLQAAVRGVTDLMVRPGLINLDFADIRSVMMEMGKAMMGTGESGGEDRAEHAAEAAINNPLLDDVSMKGARGVIINVTGGPDMTLFEVDQACNRIRDEVDPNANIIIGSTFDDNLEGIMRVSVVATGIDVAEAKGRKPSGSAWNTLTAQQQQERRMERAQPNTDSAPVSTPAQVTSQASVQSVSQTSVSSAPSAPVRVSGGSPVSASATARKLEEPEADMFSQPELTVSEPVEKKPEAAGQNGDVLRGTIYNNAFIPPKPVDGGQARVESPYGPQFASQPQQPSAPAEAPVQTVTGPGLNLRPPVPGAGNQQKRRTASLFERITHPLRHHEEAQDDGRSGEGRQEGGSSAGGAFHTGLRATARPQQQGNLNIEAPSIKADQPVEDELDIPAFLRRQAN